MSIIRIPEEDLQQGEKYRDLVLAGETEIAVREIYALPTLEECLRVVAATYVLLDKVHTMEHEPQTPCEVFSSWLARVSRYEREP